MSTEHSTKASIRNYVQNFIDKRDSELRGASGDDDETQLVSGIDQDSIEINTGDDAYSHEKLDKRASSSLTDIDADELNLEADPTVETQEGGEQVYKQQVYLRQYQPPTPEPIDIQVQEVVIKPQVQRPPIHVHVGANQNRDTQRTPSPILIKSAPPQPLPALNEPLIYNKYIPVDYKPPPQQIIIHRYPKLPPKPRPIVVEQWLPNKPAPKRITYRHVNREEYVQNEIERQRNRFIEYTKPHTTIEVEIVRLPIVKLRPEEYQEQSSEPVQLNRVRSIAQDPNTLNWRI
jgi:hypothetical protein